MNHYIISCWVIAENTVQKEKESSRQMENRYCAAEDERKKMMFELEKTQLVNMDFLQSLNVYEVG